MQIKILLNDLKYRYDVYQVVNIFYPQYDIKFVSEEADYDITLEEDRITIKFGAESRKYDVNVDNQFKEEVKKVLYRQLKEITGIDHPWGTLVGIRPAKIASRLMEENLKEEEIVSFYKKHYLTSEEKALLCIDVAKEEKNFIYSAPRSISLYLGMPFCPTRCVYCSFASNSIAGKKQLVEKYLEALIYEIKGISEYIKSRNLVIETMYFGGGTPTAVNNEQFERLLKNVYNNLVTQHSLKEFTVEAGRPDSITDEKLKTMKKYGVTRISINPQTMNDKTLKKIGRAHTVEDVKEKFRLARDNGFDNINMDLIIGLPDEGLEEISNTCSEILQLNPESLTVHGMSVKRASKLHEMIVNNQFKDSISIDELSSMYHLTRKTSEELSMNPYYLYRQKNMVGNMENIGYSKKGFECIYNVLIMEERQTIIALGADAVTKVVFKDENRIERHANLKDVQQYIDRIDEELANKIQLLDSCYKY